MPASVSVSPSRTVRSSAISTVPGQRHRARERALARRTTTPVNVPVSGWSVPSSIRSSPTWPSTVPTLCSGAPIVELVPAVLRIVPRFSTRRSRSPNTVAVPRRSISPRFSSTRPVASDEMPLSTSVPVDLRRRPGRPSCRPSTRACRSPRSRRRASRPSACAATTFTVPLTVAPAMAASLVSLPPTSNVPAFSVAPENSPVDVSLPPPPSSMPCTSPSLSTAAVVEPRALVGPGDADRRAAGAVDRRAGCRACPRPAARAPADSAVFAVWVITPVTRVVPAPVIAPPDHVVGPLSTNVPVPPSVPEDSVVAPLAITVPVAFSVAPASVEPTSFAPSDELERRVRRELDATRTRPSSRCRRLRA